MRWIQLSSLFLTGLFAACSGGKGGDGNQGPVGERGPQGAVGEKGEHGPSGPSGPSGQRGETGLMGPSGSQGPSGPSGATGLLGLTGATGPSGPIGVTGPSGASGPRGGGVVWKDIAGAVMPVVVSGSAEIGFLTPDNVVWSTSGGFRSPPSIVAWREIESVHYTGINCTGTGHVRPLPPRYAIQFSNGTYWTANDNAALATQVDILSSADGPPPSGVCNNPSLSYQLVAIPVTDFRQVSLPTSFPGSPPYHPEIVP